MPGPNINWAERLLAPLDSQELEILAKVSDKLTALLQAVGSQATTGGGSSLASGVPPFGVNLPLSPKLILENLVLAEIRSVFATPVQGYSLFAPMAKTSTLTVPVVPEYTMLFLQDGRYTSDFHSQDATLYVLADGNVLTPNGIPLTKDESFDLGNYYAVSTDVTLEIINATDDDINFNVFVELIALHTDFYSQFIQPLFKDAAYDTLAKIAQLYNGGELLPK